ncbi:MAG: proprotein convertase P-domain-containing protein [Fuerstiella sp.]
MAVLESLLATFRQSRAKSRKSSQRRSRTYSGASESLEQRLLLTNIPDYLVENAGAEHVIYLDFDGHLSTPAFDLDGQADGQFSLAELQTIEEVFLRVREDLRPFGNVELRAADPEPSTFSNGEGLHVVIGANSTSISVTQNEFSAGAEPNVAIVGQNAPPLTDPNLYASLGWDIAYRTSRAIGRAMGLDFVGGTPAIRRVDGGGLYGFGLRDIWTNSSGQDDLGILTNAANGLTFAEDDHGDSAVTATAVPITGDTELVRGVIAEDGDTDWFSFSTTDTSATFTVRGLDLTTKLSEITGANFGSADLNNGAVTPNAGANLIPELNLYDANGTLVASSTLATSLSSSLSANLTAGNYYLEVHNGGQYGNLGEFTVTIDGVDSPFALGVPALRSRPGADVTFFLDFNGHVVSNSEIVSQRADGISQPFYVPVYDTDGDRTSFSQAEQNQMTEIFRRVAEDFSPFDVNVTTMDPFVYGNQQGLLIAIGGDGTWLGPVNTVGTGFTELGTFSTGIGSNNAVAFSDNFSSPKETALETSAVIANALGIETYLDHANGGVNRLPGFPAYGPIGGDSVTSLRDIFQQGEGATAGVVQDPLAIINSAANAIPYRADDHGDTFPTASIVNVTTAVEVLNGVIEEIDDEDWFSFRTVAADATITISGLDLTVDAQGNSTGITNPGANLDPVIELFRDVTGTGSLNSLAIAGDTPPATTNNNPSSLRKTVTQTIPAGLYYIKVSNRNEYGNLGQYQIRIQDVDGTPAVLSFTTPSISENAGLVQGIGRIDRPFGQPITAPLIVDLVSTDPQELMVPAQVIIPPGQDFITFDVTAVDDDILDGDQNVTVEARVSGVLNSTAVLKVADHETITASVSPNPVREDAGPAGATLTVTRSNTDIDAANHWAAFGASLQERDPSGAVIRTIPIQWPSGVRPVAEVAHDVQVLQDGNIAVYNGTGAAFLSIYNVTTATWQHFAEPGLSANTSADPTVGGIASIGDYVFLTDLESFDGDERGIVRVNTVTGQIDRFADSSVGSRLFVLSGTSIVEINAVTGEILNSITPQATIGGFTSLEAIAFDGTNLWALFNNNTFFGTGGSNELQKLNPDTGEVVEIHSVPLPNQGFFTSFDDIGMTFLNDLLYFNLPFDNSTLTLNRAIQAYNPENRQLVGGLLPFEALNNIYAGDHIGALKGDGTAANPDVLLIHGNPDNFFFNDDRVYLIDPTTGRAIDSFATGTNLGFFSVGGGIGSLDDVIIGNTVRNGLIYLNLDNGLRIFDRNGVRVDANPLTVPFDDVPHAVPFGFDYAELAAADVPGVTAQELSFRDVSVGITDNLLYGLVENGTEISVYDPTTLIFSRSIQLDAVVNAIAVDEQGNILGGGPNGNVRIFNSSGTTIGILNTASLGLANIADVDTNISEEIIVSDINGVVVIGPRSAVMTNNAALLQVDTANSGQPTFASFGRHSKLPTGPLVISLSSDDLTELRTPTTVRIPVGQTSATINLDVIDDNELDGPQTVTIAGSAPNYVPDATQVTVLDAETIGVEIRRNTMITVSDPSLLVDGDRLRVTVNGRSTVFEVEDTSVGNGIAPSSQHQISINLSAGPDAGTVAAAIASAITTAGLGITATAGAGEVTLSGAPFFPTVTKALFNAGALSVEKPMAETTGLISNGVRVFRTDVNGPFTVPASTSGSVVVPVPVKDRDVTLSRINVVDQVSRVTDVNVTLTLQHGFIPDLDVTLVSPQGTRVRLFSDLRSNETNMTNTILDDEAAVRIVDGVAPYTGRFIPEQLLSKFDGEDPSGTWTLEIVDDNVTDDGTLFSWSLDIETLGISETRVTLVSSDTTEATVDGTTVVIPAARSEVYVDLTAVDDTLVDGTIPVTISIDALNLTGFDPGADVVDVTDVETLTISLDSLVVSEGAGAGAITGTITRSGTDLSTPLSVSLTSSDTSELAVTSPVTILAGESSATFSLDAVDDLDFDGDQQVTVTASATGYFSTVSDVITVSDQEPRLVMTTLTPSVPEDAGTVTISLSRLDAFDLSQPLQVTLQSSDLTELTVPTNLVIGIGSISTTFTATIIEDDILDGPQTVRITAADANTVSPAVNSGTLDIVVEDAEFISVTVPTGEESFLENSGAAVTTATVSVSSTGHTAPIVVTLANSDQTEISIPDQVIIPVGSNSVTFSIDAINDDVIDRDQLVAVTATANGFRDGVLNLTVRDHEPPIPTGPTSVVEDPTPTMSWNPVGGATRYDLWVNDVSRGINQLFRLDNLSPTAPLIQDSFEQEFLDINGNRTVNPALWTSTGLEVDLQSLNGSGYAVHMNGAPTGGDTLQTVDMDLSGHTGAQLKFAFQRTGTLDSPETGQDLIVSWRDASGVWRELNRQLGSGPDMDSFQIVSLQLPAAAMHSTLAIRFRTIGQTQQDGIEGAYDDWFIDDVELAVHESFEPSQELGVGRYRFWVRAYDDLEQPGFWSQARDFQIRTRPTMLSPSNQSVVAESSFPEISWTTVVDTARYDLWVNNVTTGATQVIRETNLQTTSFASSLAGLPGGTYKAWSRAIAPDGLAGYWSVPVTFTVLTAPTGIRPTGATFDRTPQLEWDPVVGATNYYVWLTLRNPAETPVVVLRDRFVTETFRIPETDLQDGRYALWVKSIAADGTESNWSSATEFYIGGRPEITAPAGQSTTSSTPIFLWTGISGAERYEFWMNRIDVPQSRVVYNPNVQVTSLSLQTPLAPGSYRVWVRAISEMGETSFWSLPVNFTVAANSANQLPDTPSLLTVSVPSGPAESAQGLAESGRFVADLMSETPDKSPEFAEAAVVVAPEQMPAANVVDDDNSLNVEEAAVDALDHVMADWDAADWWTGDAVSDEEQSSPLAASLTLGMIAAGTATRRPDRRRKV